MIEDIAYHVDLFLAGCDENDSSGMVDDREGKGDSLWRGFGRVVDVGDPSVFFCEELVTGEEGSGVTVGTHTEEDEVEYGEAGSILLCKLVDEFLLIRVGELFEVVEEGWIDGMYICRGYGDL